MHGASIVGYSAGSGVAASLAAQFADFLALLLLAAAAHKVVQRSRTRRAIQSLTGLAARAATAALAGLALAEGIAGAALLIPPLRAAGAVLAAAVWGGYFLALARAIAAGRRDVDCGCSFGAVSPAMLGARQLLRTGALALGALLVALGTAAPRVPDAGLAEMSLGRAASLACGSIALFALYLASDQLMDLRRLPIGSAR
ncbi:MAG TPA: MauE/DoxX family redox-associated membrane protein [Steroidobacteraceae bacterium]|nr:MauE/DoxX family redox-associated membrane protein [Steroidobacteraceae bacterium]